MLLPQVAQVKLAAADLSQLAQMLSGLVKMGVKPTTAWLDDMQDRAVHCLLEQAVRHQVTSDQQQQQQAPAGTSPGVDTGSSWRPLRQPQQRAAAAPAAGRRGGGSGGRRDAPSSGRLAAGCQLHDVAQLLSALAEARHAPKPQLVAALWGATAASLAPVNASSLTELLVALGELRLVPPLAWMRQLYAATQAAAAGEQYRPWQLAASVDAVGRLAAAGMLGATQGAAGRAQPPMHQQQPQDQQRLAGVQECTAWVAAMLQCAERFLAGTPQRSFAARDLVACLTGIAALQPVLASSSDASLAQSLRGILAALQGNLARLNTGGLTAAFEAAVALRQQQQVPDGFVQALLLEVAVKLPVFPADHMARVLHCAVASHVAPSPLWLQVRGWGVRACVRACVWRAVLPCLASGSSMHEVVVLHPPHRCRHQPLLAPAPQAVAAQLSSKLTLLEPPALLGVMAALDGLGSPPDRAWEAAALAAFDGRLTELSGAQLQQLLALLVGLRAQPPAAWLERAAWAVQQAEQTHQQQQGAAGAAAASGDGAQLQRESQALLAQLQHAGAGGMQAPSSSAGSSVESAAVPRQRS
jgi:hypothetical protein